MNDNNSKHDEGCFVDLLFAAVILALLVIVTAQGIVSCVG